jgi:hypothetical protein
MLTMTHGKRFYLYRRVTMSAGGEGKKKKNKGRSVPDAVVGAPRKQKSGPAYPHALGEVMLHVEVKVMDAAGQLLDFYERDYHHDKELAKAQFDAISKALAHNEPPA